MKSWDTEWPDLYLYLLVSSTIRLPFKPRASQTFSWASVVPPVKPPGHIAPMENASHGCYWEQYVQFSKEKKKAIWSE